MKSIAKILVGVVLTVFLLGMAAYASTTVCTFDDLVGQAPVPDGYCGITWSGNWTYYGFSQPPYNPHSPPNRIYDQSNSTNFFSFPTPEVFQGAWIAGNSFATVTFDLYNGNNLVWTSATGIPTDTPTFLASGYSGLVTKVVVDSPAPDFFILDDVTYGTGGGTPEPASLLLLGSGLLALGSRARKALRK
jgi:hypothetical protein